MNAEQTTTPSDSNSHSTTIRLVCFDLGGVIMRICRSWEEGCGRAGVPLRGMEDRAKTADERMSIVTHYQTGTIDCDAFSQQISETLGGIYSPEEIMAVHHAWCIGQYPGVEDVIDEIHGAGLDTACLSNTNHAHWETMPGHPAFMKLRTRLASHVLGLHKPDHAIYHAAQAKLGLLGREILFFDDLEDNIVAARECGWHAVLVDPAGDTASQILSALPRRNVGRD